MLFIIIPDHPHINIYKHRIGRGSKAVCARSVSGLFEVFSVFDEKITAVICAEDDHHAQYGRFRRTASLK